MSLLFFDGFDWNTPGASVAASTCYTFGWAEYNVDLWYGGDKTGANAGSAGISPNYMIRYIGQNISTIYFGVHYRPTQNGNTTIIFRFIDSATVQCGFGLNSSRQLTFYRGPSSTLLGTSSNSMTLSQYYWLCGKVVFHGTTGSYEIRVNGTNWLSGSNVNTITTTNAFCNKFSLGVNGSTTYTVDDFILYDSAGSAPFNDFITERQIITKKVTSDDVTTGWTPSAGTAWDAVNDADAPDGDSTYVACAAALTPITFGHAGGFPTAGKFDAVKVQAVVRAEEASARHISGALKIGSTVYYDGVGEQPYPSGSYKDCPYTTHVNPATLGPIGGAALNSAKIGAIIVE